MFVTVKCSAVCCDMKYACDVKYEKYISIYFSQNQKEFGCIGAAVLLILSPKELISQKKTRQSTLAVTATRFPLFLSHHNFEQDRGSDSQS